MSPLEHPGRQLGPYRIERFVASGGFADVYLATQLVLDLSVALKVVRDPSEEQRERRGARLMCRLDHPGIVRVHFADRIDGRFVVAMDFVEGETLRDRIAREGRLPERDAVRIASEVVSALSYVHALEVDGQRGVAHLDLKPGNILLARDGRAKLTDFGLAQVVSGAFPPDRVAGSVAYISPEQLAGNPTVESDVWAMGVVLHEMLTGEKPMRVSVSASGGGTFERATGYCAGLSSALTAIVGRCLEIEPRDRFDSAAALGEALAEVTNDRCERCGAPLGTLDFCTECTFADGPTAKASLVPSAKPRVAVLGAGARSASWGTAGRVAAGLLLSVMAALAVYAGTEARQAMRTRTERQQAARDLLVAERAERSPTADYAERVAALDAFLRRWPTGVDAPGVAARRARWQAEADAYVAAEQAEHASVRSASKAIAAWGTFLAAQWSGTRRGFAESRVSYWRQQLATYDGWAVLKVISASGLPAPDAAMFGEEQADPYFVLRSGDDFVYRSQSKRDTPAPTWSEEVRVRVKPGRPLSVEIVDRNLIVDTSLATIVLEPLPPDGRFTGAAGTITAAFEIRRER